MEKTIKDSSRCISPYYKKAEAMAFPCGKCVNCKKRRVSGWSFRLLQQFKIAKSAWFVTFTYTTDTVPLSKKGRMTLDKRDWQLFMKRLRKVHQNKIVYYTCGEYGSEKYRPHYHAIMYDVELEKLIGEEMASKVRNNAKAMLTGKTQIDCPLWGKGHITIGTVSAASIGYVLEYISKAERIPQYKGDDREPEFSLMSKGIGKNYINPQSKKWHKADIYNRFYSPLQDGKKASLPRYYREKIYTKLERERIGKYLENKERDENMTKSMEEIDEEMVVLQAWRSTLATTGNREKRSLKL